MAEPEYTLTEKGLDGEVTLTTTHVTLRHYWQSKNGRGTATYPLSSVTGVEFRPGALQARFTLVISGGVQRSDKKGDPLTVLVGKKNIAQFEQMRDLILQGIDAHQTAARAQAAQAAVQAAAAAQPAAAPSLAQQIQQLAALHAQGVLTAEEFAAAKARLLGGGPQDAL